MAGKIEVTSKMIAPCGMNCALCYGRHRDKNVCLGCRTDAAGKPNHCYNCSIKNCSYLSSVNGKYCFQCSRYPCRRLKDLDKRYRTKYGMSMIENLESIKKIGIRKFTANEKLKWKCSSCGEVLCVHREFCTHCGSNKLVINWAK